VLKIKTMV